MSLQVWLPLTKDLRNQGLDGISVTSAGAINLNDNGKLGKCYKTSNTGFIDLKYAGTQINTGSISLCGWFKFNKSELAATWSSYSFDSTHPYPTGNLIGNNSYGGVGLIWYTNSLASGATFTSLYAACSIRSTTNGARITNVVTIPFDMWVHLALVFNKDTKALELWMNGELKVTSTMLDFNDARADNLKLNYSAVWGGNGPSYNIPFLVNDVRIYDHALSTMEVKELSKGLVLHYPLNRMGFGQDNLATCTTPQYTISASSTSNYNFFWINSSTLEPNTTYTFSAEVEVSDNIKECTIYNYTSSGNSGSITYTFPADGKRHSWTFTTTTTGLGLIGYAGKAGATAGHSAVYRNIKVEKGDKATPYIPRSNEVLYTTMGLNGTTEYDTSGYCNNGIQNNSPTYSSDTAKYNVSTHLDGVNQTIQLPNLLTLIPDSIFTFNIWFKRLQSEPSSKPWETLFGGPSGFEIETCSANNVHNNKIKAYSWGGGTIEFEFDKWNMLTMVSNGTNALFYLNGELKLTGTYRALVSGNYFIGSWSNTATQNYKGYVCDARIYATALSADDVKSLYQNSAYIDSSGNVYGAVHSEV